MTSPEVPEGKFLVDAVPTYLSEQQLESNGKVLTGVDKTLDISKLLAELPPIESATAVITQSAHKSGQFC